MQHGEEAVSLLTEADFGRALAQATRIEALNTERRDTDQAITEEALTMIRELGEEDRSSTVVYKEDWHKGVIGIVASRLIETYYRPTLVFTKSGDKLAASARSVRGFDLYEALEACSDCLVQFGGHTYAAGLTLEVSRFEEFKARFEEQVARTIHPDLLTPEIHIDLPIHLSQVNARLMRILRQFAPFGPGNHTPAFLAGPLHDTGYAKAVGESGDHLKLAVTQNGAGPFGAIGFGLGDRLEQVRGRQPFQAVFSVEENSWQGQTSIQLRLRDLKRA
jgi:single-stranded-DNA-specific exonuclease